MNTLRFLGPTGAWLSAANTHHRAGEIDAALALCERILTAAPRHAEALCLRGNLHAEQGDFAAALADFTAAGAIQPDAPAIAILCARALAELGRLTEAWTILRPLYAAGQVQAPLAAQLLRRKLFFCDWDDVAELLAVANRDLAAGRPGMLHFLQIALEQDRPAQLRCARALAAEFQQPARPQRRRDPGGRIRIAYLSADLHVHATSYLMAELFELHRRDRFEVTALSYGEASDAPLRRRLQAGFERFVDVADQSDSEIADLIQHLQIDIAIDLKGYTDNARPGILASRPAPVQIGYLGYPATTGAPWMDYLLADRQLIPPAHFADYSEAIVWLPDSYQPNDRQRRIGTPGQRGDHGLPAHGFVFACLNDSFKIQPAMFAIWLHLLRATEGSVLWLLSEDATCIANLRRAANSAGIDPDRLVFAPRMELADHVARLQLADLFLDTLPCNAHTTASDALWAGLPVLTCLGETFTARVAASLLHAAGLPELIVADLAEYQALALRLTTEPALLTGLRQRLIADRDTCALFDTPRFRDGIEAAYEMIWQRHRAGLPPAHITVPAP